MKTILESFARSNVLLLQGPIGPFFRRLSKDLKAHGARTFKINFNGGDFAFFPFATKNYLGSLEDWPAYLNEFCNKHSISHIFIFGDCRPVHLASREFCERSDVNLWVFEEGYLRPDFITFEKSGVNGHSLLSKNPEDYRLAGQQEDLPSLPVGNTWMFGFIWSVIHFNAYWLWSPFFRKHVHHRPYGLKVAIAELKGMFLKLKYKRTESGILEDLSENFHNIYFLLPLQVRFDAQITNHSSFESIETFIEKTMAAFAKHAPKYTILVYKHHPAERGYINFEEYLYDAAEKHNVLGRVLYVYDLHLPTLIKNCRGMITVNSTAGLSGVFHKKPVKVCGHAIYDIPGLTFQGSLDSFFQNATTMQVDTLLFSQFRSYLLNSVQFNGNFYKRFKSSKLKSGIG